MQGHPLLRLLVVLLGLAGMAVLVARTVRSDAPPAPAPPVTVPGDQLAAFLTVQFSAPVDHFRLADQEGNTLAESGQPGITLEADLLVPAREDSLLTLLTVKWTEPGPNRFVRLVLEPEERETREFTLHAPADLLDHAVEFRWPEAAP